MVIQMVPHPPGQLPGQKYVWSAVQAGGVQTGAGDGLAVASRAGSVGVGRFSVGSAASGRGDCVTSTVGVRAFVSVTTTSSTVVCVSVALVWAVSAGAGGVAVTGVLVGMTVKVGRGVFVVGTRVGVMGSGVLLAVAVSAVSAAAAGFSSSARCGLASLPHAASSQHKHSNQRVRLITLDILHLLVSPIDS
jgi:hypothetical protein